MYSLIMKDCFCPQHSRKTFYLLLNILKASHDAASHWQQLASSLDYRIFSPTSLLPSLSFTSCPPRSRFHSWVKFSPLRGDVMVF